MTALLPKNAVEKAGRLRRIERAPLDESEVVWAETDAGGFTSVVNGFDVVLAPAARGRWTWALYATRETPALARVAYVVVTKGESDGLRGARHAAMVSAYRRAPGGLIG
jgi:hypothetical protein